MGKLLFDEPSLTVSPSLAVIVGLEEAIVLQQVKYWIHYAIEGNIMVIERGYGGKPSPRQQRPQRWPLSRSTIGG